MDDTHDRLARLEAGLADVRVDVAAISTQVKLGFDQLGDKLDKLDNVPARVQALEVVNERRASRFKVLVKVVGGALSAVLAALALVFLGLR